MRRCGDALQQLAGRGALVLAHAGDGFVEQQRAGLLHEHHPDLQPLLLAVRQDAGRRVALVAESGLLQRQLDRRIDAAPGPQQRERGAVEPGGDVEVLQHRELLEDARGLEGAADSEPDDLVRRTCRAAPGRRASPIRCPWTGPVMASMQVVLPAPFGPMRNRTSPGWASKETPPTATNPSNSTLQIGDDERTLGGGHFFTSSSTGLEHGCRVGQRAGGVRAGATPDPSPCRTATTAPSGGRGSPG